MAAWLTPGEKPRPSSFIPAPPRASSPFTTAAPPASSDRLVDPAGIEAQLAFRTFPIRVDVEQSGGRIYIGTNPQEIAVRVGDGVEWDFRYTGGSDIVVDEMIVEIAKPSPFARSSFRSRKPGSARPHRQILGPAQPEAAGRRVEYVIRAMTAFGTEVARSRALLVIN